MLPGRFLDIQIFHAIVAETRGQCLLFLTFLFFFSLSPKRIKNKLFPFDLPSILSIYRARQDLHFTTR